MLITLAFFAICVGLVKACDAVIGPDELDDPVSEPSAAVDDLVTVRS